MDNVHQAMSQVPWKSLGGFHCERVPEAIVHLLSNDPSQRRIGHNMLENHVILQGGLFESAFYVIPFLAEICKRNSENTSIEAISFLIELACGSASFKESVRFKTVQFPFVYFLPCEEAVEIPLSVAVRYALGCCLPSLIELAQSEFQCQREHYHELIGMFPEFAGSFAEPIAQLRDSTSDVERKAEYNRMINQFQKS